MPGRNHLLKATLIAASALALLIAGLLLPLGDWVADLVQRLRAAGPGGAFGYGATFLIAAVFMVPGAFLTIGAGMAYGTLGGVMLASPASLAGATLAFVLGRKWWAPVKSGGIGSEPRFRAVSAAIGQHGTRMVILIRLSPVLPSSIMNYALAGSRIRLRDYVLGSWIGMFPATVLYAHAGSLMSDAASASGGAVNATGRSLLSGLGLLATAVIVLLVSRTARRLLADELTRAGTPPPPSISS